MAPHWTLALLLMISVFLGIGRAFSTCEFDGDAECVEQESCVTKFNYRSDRKGCRDNKVCCRVNNIYKAEPNSCGNRNMCVDEDLCQTQVDLRRGGQCAPNMICCKPEDVINKPKAKSCGNGMECVADNLCREEVGFRMSNGCSDGLICCEVEKPNTLSVFERL